MWNIWHSPHPVTAKNALGFMPCRHLTPECPHSSDHGNDLWCFTGEGKYLSPAKDGVGWGGEEQTALSTWGWARPSLSRGRAGSPMGTGIEWQCQVSRSQEWRTVRWNGDFPCGRVLIHIEKKKKKRKENQSAATCLAWPCYNLYAIFEQPSLRLGQASAIL